MPKPIFYGRLDFIELMTSVAMLNSDAEKSAWLMSFCTALAKNETGKNDLADSILLEAQKARIEESKRKEAYRAKFVPRTDTDGHGRTRERQTVSVSVPVIVNTDNTIPPLPPKGKSVVQIPNALLLVEGFTEAWADWIEHLKQKRKPPTQKAMVLQLKKLSDSQNPIAMIHNSIEKGYQGLFEPVLAPIYGQARETTTERINRENMARLAEMQREETLNFIGVQDGR